MATVFVSPEVKSVFELVDSESASTIAAYLKKLQADETDNEAVKKFINQRNAKNQTVLHIVCSQHHLDKTQVLLEAGANPNVRDQEKQTPAFLVVVGLLNCNCEECTKKAVSCLTLLSYYDGKMEIADDKNRTPLFLCAENRFLDCAKAILLSGCYLGSTPNDDPIINMLVDKIPGALETVFDSCVKMDRNGNIDDPEFGITFDLGVIVPCKTCSGKGETTFLRNLIRKYSNSDFHEHDPTSCILRHPLIAVFMDIKWKALESWYVGFLVFQFLFLIAYTSLISVTVFYDCPYQRYTMLRETGNTFSSANFNNATLNAPTMTCQTRKMNRIFGVVIILNTLLMLGHEVQRAITDFKEYRSNLYHYLNFMGYLLVIFTAFITIALDHTSPVYSFLYPISAFTISMIWCQMFVLMGKLPQLAIYVEMLVQISANFCKTLAIYSFLIVGFAISFCILFYSNPELRHFPISISKVLSMLVGELEHETLMNPTINDKNDESSMATGTRTGNSSLTVINNELSVGQQIAAYFWYVGVLIMVTLVLMNLLVGLAVSDIQSIRENSELFVIKRRIRYISYLEGFFLQLFGDRLWSKWNLMAIKDIICPVELKDFKITVYPNDPKFKDISKEAKHDIKRWIESSNQRIRSNILRECKGNSPDSSSMLTKRKNDMRRFLSASSLNISGQNPNKMFLGVGQASKQTVDSDDRLQRLEEAIEQLNFKLDMIFEEMSTEL